MSHKHMAHGEMAHVPGGSYVTAAMTRGALVVTHVGRQVEEIVTQNPRMSTQDPVRKDFANNYDEQMYRFPCELFDVLFLLSIHLPLLLFLKCVLSHTRYCDEVVW